VGAVVVDNERSVLRDLVGRVVAGVTAWTGRPWRQRATQTYACILLATTLLLSGANSRLDNAVLRSASTNLLQLRHHPLLVLVSSAFWTETGGMWGFALIALIVFAPLEAWAGWWRWLVVFVAGHIGATLVVAAGLAIAIHINLIGTSVSRSIDVGYSYGAWCSAAFLVYRLPFARRLWAVGVLSAILIASIIGSGHYSTWGHLVAALIGWALYPLRPDRAGDNA